MEDHADIVGMMFRCRADASLSFTFADDGARSVCGYTPAELVDTGFITLPDLIHPEERDKVRAGIQAGISEKVSFAFHARLQVKDRTPAEGILIGSGVFKGPLSLSGIDGYIIRVLAAPVRTTAGEMPSPEVCVELLNHTEDVIALLNEDGMISYITPSVLRILDQKPAAVVAMPFSHLLVPADQKRFDEFRAQVVSGGGSSARFGVVLPGGENRQISIRAFSPGGISGLILSLGRAGDHEEGSKGKDTLYHDLFARMPVPAIITTASDLRILEMNHAAAAYAPQLSPATTGTDLRDIEIISRVIIDQIREGLGIADQVELTDTDQRENRVRVMAREIQSRDQDLIIWTLTPEHDQAEKPGAEESLDSIREIRHSYINQLQTVRNILSQNQLSIDRPEHDTRYGKILLDAIIQLYDAGGRKGGGIAICRYLRRMVEQISSEYPEELVDIDLSVICPGEEIVSERHANILGIISGELIVNALYHAFEPGQPGRIDLSLRREEDWFIFQVQDTGKGLPESIIRAGSTTSGFTIIENLALELSGTMTLANDGGAVIRIIFPAPSGRP